MSFYQIRLFPSFRKVLKNESAAYDRRSETPLTTVGVQVEFRCAEVREVIVTRRNLADQLTAEQAVSNNIILSHKEEG